MDRIHFRHLVATGLSAQHGKYLLDGGEEDETYPMERGTAVHAILFGSRPVVGYHEGRPRNGKAWEAFQADQPPGTEILTAKEYAKASAMAEAVRRDPWAMRVLFGPGVVHEQTVEFDLLGRACAGTPDVRAPDYIAELKTTKSAHPDKFRWQSARMHYHAALAWYMQGVRLAGVAQPNVAYIVAVESKAPYPVTVHRVNPRAIEAGDRQVRLWMERLLACEAAGEWPGYAQAILDLDLPDAELELDYGTAEEEASP